MENFNSKKQKLFIVHQAAFTLIELLVVIAIIGILSGLIIVTMSGATESARIAKLKVYSNSVRDALGANLVSEWKFDENANPSANKTPDTWGGNTGTISGSPILKADSECVSGKCLSFNGSTDYVDCGSGTNLDITDAITISAWIKPANVSGAKDIIQKTDNGNFEPYRLYLQDDYIIFQLSQDASTRLFAQTNVGVISTNWQHVVATYNKSAVNFYVNGVYKINVGSTPTYSLRTTTTNLYMGFRKSGSNCYFNGLMDEVRIYNAALSSFRIREDYLAGLNKLFANNGITQTEYNQRISELNESIAEK